MTAAINVTASNNAAPKPKSKLFISSVFGFYIITTISMVLINKIVLKKASLPFTFLWGQMIVASILLQAAQFGGLFAMPSFKLSILKNLFPLIAINVVGLSLNTLCLQFADAMMYQIARSLVLPITVVLTPLLLKESVSLRVAGCCLIIAAGFSVGMLGEQELKVSAKGIIFGALSSLSTALHTIIIKQSFGKIEEKSPYDMVYYNNVLSALFLIPAALIEVKPLMAAIVGKDTATLTALFYGVTVAGIMGLLVNFASFLQIKVTSPLTHTVASAARGMIQSVACYFVLGEIINVPRGVGIGVTLAGTTLYSVSKIYEKNRAYLKVGPVDQPIK